MFLLFQPDAWVKKEGNYLFEKIQLQLYRRAVYELLDRYDTMENRVLKHSNYFQNVMRELENYTNFMGLQLKMDKELILFGRFRIYQKEIDTPRKLIAEMIDFIFYGVSAKVGRAELVLRGGKEHEILTEVSRDYISKYVSGEQKKFTVAVKTALYYRIKYSFENREHFASLLWQFLYYAFSLDFYMIESNEDWLRLVKELLFRQVFVSLPDDVWEAAQLDHCNPVKYFFTMVLPMSKTVVATVSVFTFLNVWNDYLWPSLVFTSSDLLTAQIGLNSITSNDNTTMGQTLAVITLITIPVIIIYALFSKQIVEGVVSTGSKEG